MRTLKMSPTSWRPMSDPQSLTVAIVAIGLVAASLVSGATAAATAQSRETALPGTASLTGTVEAPARFQAARVYIRNVDRRMLYMVYTQAGDFRAVALLPGNYEISVQAQGLESDVQNLVIEAGDDPHVSVSLRETSTPRRFPSAVDGPARDLTLRPYDEIYPPGPGRQVAEEVCMVCHGENFLPMRPRDAAGWQAALDLMMGKNLHERHRVRSGEGILAPPATNFRFGYQDQQDLLAYLTEHFGPDSEPRAVRPETEIPLDEAALGKAQFIEYYLAPDAPPGAAADTQSEGELGRYRNRVAYTLQLDAEGNAWLVDRGNPNRLVWLDPRTGEQKDYVLPDPRAGVHEILVDREGIVWVPELGGTPPTREYRMLGFNPETEKWEHQIVADPDDMIRNPNKVGMHASTLDSKGNLYMNWFGNGAIGKWERATGKVSIYRIPTPAAIPYGMAIDKNDNVWSSLWNNGKVAKFDTTTEQWTEFSAPTYPANIRRGVGVDAENNVWFGIYAAGNRPGKLAKLDQTTGRIIEWDIPYRPVQPYEATADVEDNIWFPDTSPPVHPAVLAKFDRESETFTFYPKPQAAADSPKLQQAADGAVWYTARTAIPGATGFGVLYPDKDQITTLAGYPLNGPPGYAFEVDASEVGSAR